MQTLQSLEPPPTNAPFTSPQSTPSFLTSLFPNAQGPIATGIRIFYRLKSHKWIPRWLSGKFDRMNDDHGWGLFRTAPKDVTGGKALKVLDLLEHAVDLGNLDAVYMLAHVSLFPPPSLPLNASRAFHYFDVHAETTGNATSQATVAFFYATGYEDVVEVDQAKALLRRDGAWLSKLGWNRGELRIVWLLWNGGRTLPRTLTHISDLDGGVYGPGASVASTGLNAYRAVIKAAKSRGTGETWDDLLEFYQFHADREEVEYAFRLGKIYYQGSIYSPPGGIASGAEGVGALPHDFMRAKFYFLKIARHVWPPQPLNSPKRNIHLTRKEGVDENTMITASAAAAYLGRMYLRGEGVKQDAKIAKIWFERGSEFNDKECHNGLGIIWRDGLVDNKVDEKTANEYFLAAASQDLAEAQVNLGKYHYNRGEYPFAIKYFEAAIRHGSPFEVFYYIASVHARRAMDPQSTPSLSAGSCGVAVSFYKLVAERGSWRTDLVGEAERLWSSGGEAEKRAAKLRWWMAAEQGLEVAQNNLAYVLDQHKSMLRLPNSEKPSNWTARLALIQWTRSAAQHDVDALVKVGDYYYHGLGVDDEPQELRWEKAAGYYLSAVDTQRSALAMWNLGWMYENGMGVNKDYHLAKRYYDMALDTNSEAYLPVLLSLVKLHIQSLWYTLSGGRNKGLTLWGIDSRDDDQWYLGKARDEFAKRWRGRKGSTASAAGTLDANQEGGALESDDPVQWAKDQKDAEIERARAEEEAYERGDFFSGDFLATGNPRRYDGDGDREDEFWETLFLVALCMAISALIFVRGRYVARAEMERRRHTERGTATPRPQATQGNRPPGGAAPEPDPQGQPPGEDDGRPHDRPRPHPIDDILPEIGLFPPGEEPPDDR
ncbi:hypothetical protein BS47DRAFT_1359232 [Hydnum rufescens UP504]|uniref:HCP-like protein n=1 Tax=Hydnum rufescens UP504 TaxID=1448309 RepID=A0A9P6B5N8_9AGAM|nr:hypothetical protein BS47DRAFT_1359232 [Hydnum rufescens UP504]